MTRLTRTRSHEPEESRIPDGTHRARDDAVQKQLPGTSTKNSNIRFDDVVSLMQVKDLTRSLLPTSKARELVSALNDSETRWVALGQLLLIHKFLWNERKSWKPRGILAEPLERIFPVKVPQAIVEMLQAVVRA
jgi:hypothetical protein